MKIKLLSLLAALLLVGCEEEVVTQILFEKPTTSILLGETKQLKVNHTPSELPAPTCTWESSNTDVATVDSKGAVTAISLGETTISATALNNLKATCIVTVKPIEATAIELNMKSLSLKIGEEETLTYKLIPENTTDKNASWSSDDTKVATVDSKGNVKAIGVGETKIRVKTKNGIEGFCNVSVSSIKLENITLTESIELEITDKKTLEITFTPENATNKNVTWKSQNAEIATVTKDGIVEGIMDGETVITATSEDGELTANCQVKVTPIKVKSISLNAERLTYAIGEVFNLNVEIFPRNAANQKIIWKSSNPNVATISETGRITTKAVGTTKITSTTEDGGFVASCNIAVKGITELVKIGAWGKSIAFAGNGFFVSLQSRIINPTSIPITLNLAILLDENRNALDIQPLWVSLTNGQSYKTVYKEFFFDVSSFDPGSRELLSRYKVRYQYYVNGKLHIVEQSIDSSSWGGG